MTMQPRIYAKKQNNFYQQGYQFSRKQICDADGDCLPELTRHVHS